MNLYKTIFAGVVTGGEVRAVKRRVSPETSHLLHSKNRLPHGLKWRFVKGGSDVFWWEPPDAVARALVHEWLTGRGEHPSGDVFTRWGMSLTDLIATAQAAGVDCRCLEWRETIAEHH